MNLFIVITILLFQLGLASAQEIRAGRAIQIMIQGVPTEEKARVDGTYPVSTDGSINMPYVGRIQAAGLSPQSLASVIQSSYRNAGIYSTPTIQVIASSSDTLVEQYVTIGGLVRSPGKVAFQKGMTLYEAIQSVGGANEFGSLKRVKIYREGKYIEVDLTKAENLGFLLDANDTVQVSRKGTFER